VGQGSRAKGGYGKYFGNKLTEDMFKRPMALDSIH
jgi:hypothetical protein